MSNMILQFNYTDTWIARLDPRTKFLFILNMVIVSIIVTAFVPLLGYLLVIYLILSVNYGWLQLFRFIWYMKYLFMLLFAFNYLLSQTIEIDVLVVSLRIIILIFSFYILNQSTNPDQIVDALMKLRIPVFLAWVIGTTIRQTVFLIDDMQDLMAIQKIRNEIETERIDESGRLARFRSKIQLIFTLLSATFSKSILNASDLGDVLYIRGFESAHREMTLHTTTFTRLDLYFTFIFVIIPNLLIFTVL
ncbi:MAG: energy-coupling factor transporter transmembrane protein EcfT [Candidatus Heimdallarchaeota archaeon]|nr:energy-coupling factor transporter transmembrane protein EcfT [Candidatus Heimdallarchaeota archaeon]